MAEGYKGDYAPELFNEEKRYALLQAQELASLTDAELRDLHEMSNAFTRRVVQNEVGDSVIDNGFKIVAHPTDSTNNFRITGGNGTLDAPGVLFLKGHRLFLRNSIGYKDQTNTGTLTDDAFTETHLSALTTPTGTDQTLNSITSASGVILSVGDLGAIVRSTDAGRNFSPYPPTGTNLYGIDFGDTTSAFAVGLNGTILKTANAGNTWVQLPLSPPINNTNLYAVSFVDQNYGYVVGGSGSVFGTVNGAGSWNQLVSGTQTLRAVDRFDSTRAWVVGDNGTIVYFDGTSGWVDQTSNTTRQLNGVKVLDNNSTAVVCGSGGLIKKTVNYGTTWVDKTSGTTADLFGLSFSDATRGWAAGASGVVTRTLNGGETWTSQIIDASHNFYSIFFTDTTGFVVGDAGIIYRTTDGTTWERYRTDYVYVDFHLAEVSADTTGGSEYIDTSLEDMVVGLPSANRLRIVQDVKVSEGWNAPTDYTYSDGTHAPVQHYTYPLAKLQRSLNNGVISQSDITDLRIQVRTIAELDNALKSGIDGSAIIPGSIDSDKLIPGSDYTFGSVHVLRDTTIAGDLLVEGILHVQDLRTSTIIDNLTVSGSTVFGDTSSPLDSTVSIYGSVTQLNDTSSISYNLHASSVSSASPVFNIQQDGSGSVFKILKLNDSTYSIFDMTSYGTGYDLSVVHFGTEGGILKTWDDSTGDSFNITKDASNALGSVFQISSNALGPIFDIVNKASGSPVSVKIDQTGGVALSVTLTGDATGLFIHSSGCTDLQIQHDGTSGHAIDIRSASATSAINIRSTDGESIHIDQQTDENAVTINMDSTTAGHALEVNHFGLDPAIQINSDGSGIGLHVSHVGSSSEPAVDIYVAGDEMGPALRINKANNDSTDDVGQAVYILNQGFSQSLQIFQDNTDSTSPMIQLSNNSHGYDIVADTWWVDRSGNFVTLADVTSARFAFDATHYLSADSIWLDGTNFDSSNPGVAGRVFVDAGILMISDGTSPLPTPSFGQTGPQGVTGLRGPTGIQGLTGIAGIGYTGLQGLKGDTGIQGQTGIPGGPPGPVGSTGIQGPVGPSGGPAGATGIRGSTGLQGFTGVQGLGLTGVQGSTGVQGQLGPQGSTGPLGNAFSFNNVSRYAVTNTSGEEVWCESSSTVYQGLSWLRPGLGTQLIVNRTAHGHVAGNRVIIRNTNMDYQEMTIDSTTADSFSVTTANSGDTSGFNGAYGLGFTYAHIGFPKTGGVLTAPTGDHADAQLLALRIRTGGRIGTTYDLTVPANAVNGAGADTSRGDCFIPDFNVRFDSDTLSAVGATMAINNGGSGYNNFRFGNLGSNSVFIVTHF